MDMLDLPPLQISDSILSADDESQTTLIALLKWLETPRCREVMTEEDRVEKRKAVTIRFRRTLMINQFIQQRIERDLMDELYN
jgi:hypothetical protein